MISETIVYIPGVWDLLHIGHLQVLLNAANLGDRLVVGVPNDHIVLADKGQLPIVPVNQRKIMLECLWFVDVVLPYDKLEFITHLNQVKPDILAVGSTWGKEKRHKDAEKWVEHHGRRMVVLPYTQGISTTILEEKIYERVYARKQREREICLSKDVLAGYGETGQEETGGCGSDPCDEGM